MDRRRLAAGHYALTASPVSMSEPAFVLLMGTRLMSAFLKWRLGVASGVSSIELLIFPPFNFLALIYLVLAPVVGAH
jgi:hypothetical protein